MVASRHGNFDGVLIVSKPDTRRLSKPRLNQLEVVPAKAGVDDALIAGRWGEEGSLRHDC